MKIRIIISAVATLCWVALHAQDRLVLINGKIIDGRLLKQSSSTLTYESAKVEMEINTNFVQEIVLQSGKELSLTGPLSLGLAYDTPLVTIAESVNTLQDAKNTFIGSVQREFVLYFDPTSESVSNNLFTSTTSNSFNSLSKEKKRLISSLRYYAYACNAFLAIVNTSAGEVKLTLFSNLVAKEDIETFLHNKTFKLIESSASSAVRNMIDNTMKPFTMKFSSPGICIFKEENSEAETLNYEIDINGQISFWSGSKKGKATIYEVVSISDPQMRYTRFVKGNNQDLITRKIVVVEQSN